ncbi:hypothetical protein FRX31_020565, partial [Thalictrum thalictroides]
VEGSSAESIDALVKVDIVKQRVEVAYETLQDVASLTEVVVWRMCSEEAIFYRLQEPWQT